MMTRTNFKKWENAGYFFLVLSFIGASLACAFMHLTYEILAKLFGLEETKSYKKLEEATSTESEEPTQNHSNQNFSISFFFYLELFRNTIIAVFPFLNRFIGQQ